MKEKNKCRAIAGIVYAIGLGLILTAFAGCKGPAGGVLTIGVVNDVSILSPVVDGFKAGMAELGYIEGKNVRYIYNGILESNQKIIDAEIEKLLSQDIDMFLTVGNQAALRAKYAVKGADTPILAGACFRPIEAGLIETMRRPGHNITGVVASGTTSKALEWLKMITPGLKKVYLPYNPDDAISISSLSGLDDAASKLGIELVLQKVHSVGETVIAIRNLPKDVGAIFMIPSSTLNSRGSELSQAAINRGIPMGASVPLDKDVLISLGTDLNDVGKRTARLAHQIRQGVSPADIPMETSEVFLTINLKTAEKIGVKIPDVILAQANKIIR